MEVNGKDREEVSQSILLLLVRLLLRLLGFPKLALALVSSDGALVAEGTICLGLALLLSDFPRCLRYEGRRDGNVLAGGGRSKLVAGRVAFLGLLGIAGEHNQALLVRLQALHIERLALLAQVPPSVVDNNANATRFFLANASLLDLGQCETTALAELAVVTDSLCSDGGAEEGERANAERGGLSLAGLTAAKLAA